ncbi:CHAP domain-containing protein [Pseudomonas sp. L-22-4S-12]|uniref:CHAP domain-containing protein n=1 Tax=Pseudomonas sp. L-22-4S-12 TaxID=2610893 RepID=UPI00132187F3|nr:CHAP domain-containing protein [Pseudomonas sp. L-22-4S-12]MWV16361.1 CHAP domain-containing protein [Pseudomonas sp. L-22-4S-12]
MQPLRKLLLGSGLGLCLLLGSHYLVTRINLQPQFEAGQVIDQFNGVSVFYNGGVNQTFGRNLSVDGYNLGIRYQCVEFVKRYYFERFGHRMPEARGHAREFFDRSLADGQLNGARNLLQFANGSPTPPRAEDILVFGPSLLNPYGHVAIVSEVNAHMVAVVQQNAGPLLSSREALPYRLENGGLRIGDERVLGWLRRAEPAAASAPASAAQAGAARL